MKKFLLIQFIFLVFISCRGKNMQRAPRENFSFTKRMQGVDENSLEHQMEMALLITDDDKCYQEVEKLLKQGANPNKMTGQFKWIDTNPLWRVEGDKKLVELFLQYGADVKNRPYVANIVSCKILADKNPKKKWLDFHTEHPQVFIYNERDVFDTIKLLLDSGADVNMKYTGTNKILIPATDWNYRRYFEKHGKSAINYCIEGNFLTLFPLLIEYGAKLDEESLKLAEETTEQTGSSEMEELVKEQWKNGNGNF